MKKVFAMTGAVGALICSSMTQPVRALETYTLDPQHTYVVWHADHFGFSKPSGKWVAKGTLSYDKQSPEKSRVDVTIQIADLATGIAELDKHLKAKLFFDAAAYPTASFVSKKVELVEGKIGKIEGDVTIKGITKPLLLNVKENKFGKNPISDKETLGFSATAILKRSNFDIKTLIPGIGDDIPLEIEVEAVANHNSQ